MYDLIVATMQSKPGHWEYSGEWRHVLSPGSYYGYSDSGFESWCLDAVESVTGTRPNRIEPDVIGRLKLAFRVVA
ncbi:hypothetical protein MR829_22495 [Paracoccus versutus]|uniref:hypothetical protein n=1 Tax=Paracoccus versutus TaxID=34007 RepID=UPI001FB57CC6|nr:hypothetical protein [Paracoccus versutus]MCJ1903105.1 hypothetical protein [Paracoccus versutus]